MIVEPSHQQRLSSRKPMCGRVEVVSIPPPMTLQQIEHLLTQFGPVLKMEIEESDFGMKKIVATFECQESSQRAAATYGDEHCTPRVSKRQPVVYTGITSQVWWCSIHWNPSLRMSLK
jgi:hypothetical protein